MSKTHFFKISFGQLDNGFWTCCPIVQNVQLPALGYLIDNLLTLHQNILPIG